MVATKFLTKTKEKKKSLNPFVCYVIIRILFIKELWQSPCILTLLLFFAVYKLLESFPAPPKPLVIPPRTIEIDEIKDCILEEERMIILVANRRMYEIFRAAIVGWIPVVHMYFGRKQRGRLPQTHTHHLPGNGRK